MPEHRRSRIILLDHKSGTEPTRSSSAPRRHSGVSRQFRRRFLLGTAAAAALLVALTWGGWWLFTGAERSEPSATGQVSLGRNAGLGGSRLLPDDNHWNTRIDNRPVDQRSLVYLLKIGLKTPVHADFGTNRTRQAVYGIPYVVVDGPAVPWQELQFSYADESDPGPYPISDDVPIEDGGDHHALILDRNEMRLYEIFGLERTANGWHAGSGAIFDLARNVSRPRGWTSADAAGLAILPGLVRADEVYDQREIRHAIRFTLPKTRRAFIYPARHQAGRGSDSLLPPLGLRLRLKSDVPIDHLPAGARVIALALKRYGMILADNGGALYLSGTADRRWRYRDTRALSQFRATDFEVIVPPPPPRSDSVAWREIANGASGFSEQ